MPCRMSTALNIPPSDRCCSVRCSDMTLASHCSPLPPLSSSGPATCIYSTDCPWPAKPAVLRVHRLYHSRQGINRWSRDKGINGYVHIVSSRSWFNLTAMMPLSLDQQCAWSAAMVSGFAYFQRTAQSSRRRRDSTTQALWRTFPGSD